MVFGGCMQQGLVRVCDMGPEAPCVVVESWKDDSGIEKGKMQETLLRKSQSSISPTNAKNH
jgi:hypothetical protein